MFGHNRFGQTLWGGSPVFEEYRGALASFTLGASARPLPNILSGPASSAFAISVEAVPSLSCLGSASLNFRCIASAPLIIERRACLSLVSVRLEKPAPISTVYELPGALFGRIQFGQACFGGWPELGVFREVISSFSFSSSADFFLPRLIGISSSWFALQVQAAPTCLPWTASFDFRCIASPLLGEIRTCSSTFSFAFSKAAPAFAARSLSGISFVGSASFLERFLGLAYSGCSFETEAIWFLVVKANAVSEVSITSAVTGFRISAKGESQVSFKLEARPCVLARASLEVACQAKAALASTGTSAIAIRGAAQFASTGVARTELVFSASTNWSLASKVQSRLLIKAEARCVVTARSAYTIRSRARAAFVESARAALTFRASARAIRAVRVRSQLTFGVSARRAVAIRVWAYISIRVRAKFRVNAKARSRITWKPKARPTLSLFPHEILIRLTVGGVDLSHRVVSWTLRFDHDAGSWVLDVVFTNAAQFVKAGEGLAPWDPVSRFNRPRPLLGSYNAVTLELNTPGVRTWKKVFTGWAGPASVSAPEVWGESDHLKATFVGISQPLKDWIIEDRLALRYTQAAISKQASPDLLNRIVMDQGFNYTIHYRDDPMFMVDEYIVSGVSLWEALTNALAPTGFRLVEWWDPVTGETKLTVIDPLRFKSQPDLVKVGGFSARNISGNESEVRTWVGVVYRDRNDFQEKFVWAESSPQILALYGIPDGRGGRKHRKMVYKTSERSLVDTESEARALAAMILWDLETPCPAVEITLPVLSLEFLPFQLVEFVGESFSTLVGITEVEHSWSWDRPVGQTIVRGARGRVVGARNLWFTRDTKREWNWERIALEEITEKPISIRPCRPYVTGSFFQHLDGTPKPVVDIIFPPPPPWATGIVLKIARLAVKDSANIQSRQGRTVTLVGKNYPAGLYRGIFSDYLVLFNTSSNFGPAYKINTVSGNAVYLAEDPEDFQADRALIVRVKRIETRTYPVLRFLRIEDVREGETIMVRFAWKGHG